MRRTREHARQIALQVSTAAPDVPEEYFPPQSPQFGMDLVVERQASAFHNKPVIHSSESKNRLDRFVERQQGPNGRKPLTYASPPAISVDTSVSSRNSRAQTVQSMPTFPSNSTMQSVNVSRRQTHNVLDEVPVSPYPLNHSKSFGSTGGGSIGSGGKSNHLVNYSQTSRANIDPGGASTSTRGGASTNSTVTSSPATSVNVFTEGNENGFTFDAFGLDAYTVDQEVSLAMKEIAGEWGDEFPVQSFDSPHGSRSPSPPQDEDGFEDGFRLTGVIGLPLQVRQSPAGSDRSSLSSSTDKAAEGRSNVFKEQAGFHASNIKPRMQQQQQNDHDGGWANFGDSAFGEPFSSSYAQSEPGFVSKPEMPKIPILNKPPLHKANDGFDATRGVLFPATPPRASPSNASNASAGDSDANVFSDVSDSSEIVGEIPKEVVGSKQKKSSRKAVEEKKQDEQDFDDESQTGWSVRSPVKTTDTWGEDMTPDDPETDKFETQTRQQQQLQHQPKNLNGAQAFTGLRKVETKKISEQQLRAKECAQQRTSFQSLKSRLKAPKVETSKTYAKSDVGGLRSKASSDELSAVLNRIRNSASFDGETKSDHGGRSPFAGVAGLASKFNQPRENSHIQERHDRHHDKHDDYDQEGDYLEGEYDDDYLDQQSYQDGEEYYVDPHQAPGPQHRNMTYGERRELELRQQQQEEDSHVEEKTKKTTYREQRELDLRKVSEEKQRKEAAEVSKKPPERDVAALIRKRIAANKQVAAKDAETSSEVVNIVNVKNRWRKVSIESKITQFKAPIREERQPEFLVHSLKKVSPSVSFGSESVKSPTPSQSLVVEETRDLEGPADATEEIIPEPVFKRDTPSPLAALHEAIASKVVATETRLVTTVSSEPTHKEEQPERIAESTDDTKDRLNALFANRLSGGPSEPADREEKPERIAESSDDTKDKLNALFASRLSGGPREPTHREEKPECIAESSDDTKDKLNALFASRLSVGPSHDTSSGNGDGAALLRSKQQKQTGSAPAPISTYVAPPVLPSVPEREAATAPDTSGRPSLKKDPKYDRYFRMLKVGMPIAVVKHAMTRDGVDASVLDGDHNKPAGFGSGVPLKEDPKFAKYFKMLNMGLPMGAVKNAVERDGLDPGVLDKDHNLPANVNASSDGEPGVAMREESKVKDTHRRTRLHWDTVRKVRSNSLWAKIDQDEELEGIEIDEDEFQELFQAELTPAETNKSRSAVQTKRGAAVRVIDSKRANNGGIVLARLKMTHDEMADSVDRIDHQAMSAEQMQNIIEYLPTSDERKILEAYMLSGGIDAAEKFDGLCECEKFMVAMMTVKHAKRKVRAVLFKLQFQNCLDSLEKDTTLVETACDELSNSVRLRKLLGIVLNVGNRLNTAGVSGKRKAGAFSLDSLLKLNHAKAFDKKTTFLHYIVRVVQRNNELLLRVKDDLPTVMKAGRVYWDQLEQDLEEVENQLENVRRISLHQARLMSRSRLRKKKKKASQTDDDENSLSDSSMSLEEEVEYLRASEIGIFTLGAIKKVSALRDIVETTKGKFAKLREYFGEEDKQQMQPHELFSIISTFCRDFEKAKEQVSDSTKKKMREERMVKRANSDPNLQKNRKTPQKNGTHPPPQRMNPTSTIRASNHQPNMHKVVKDVGERPPLNGQHPQQHPNMNQPVANGVHRGNQAPHRRSMPERPPPNGADENTNVPRPHPPARSRQNSANENANVPKAHPLARPPPNGANENTNAPRPQPPARPSQNGVHGKAPMARPPIKPVATNNQDDEASTASAPSPRMSSTSMRQKAMQRRRRMHTSKSTTDSSVRSTTASVGASSAPSMSPKNDTYTALGRRVANDDLRQLSPRSSIRQRRRAQNQRPAEVADYSHEAEFALD